MKEVELIDWKEVLFPHDVADILSNAQRVLLTGSRFIVEPPVMTTDVDIVVLVPCIDTLFKHLVDNCGWKYTYSPYWGDNRRIVRKGIFNLIIVGSEEAFYPWELATRIAKGLNLKEKEDRAFLFQTIREASESCFKF